MGRPVLHYHQVLDHSRPEAPRGDTAEQPAAEGGPGRSLARDSAFPKKPEPPPAQARAGEIALDPGPADDLCDLQARNQDLLRRMAEAEERKIISCPANAYRVLHERAGQLQRGRRGDPEDEGTEAQWAHGEIVFCLSPVEGATYTVLSSWTPTPIGVPPVLWTGG